MDSGERIDGSAGRGVSEWDRRMEGIPQYRSSPDAWDMYVGRWMTGWVAR